MVGCRVIQWWRKEASKFVYFFFNHYLLCFTRFHEDVPKPKILLLMKLRVNAENIGAWKEQFFFSVEIHSEGAKPALEVIVFIFLSAVR